MGGKTAVCPTCGKEGIICPRRCLEPWVGKVESAIRHAMEEQRKGASVTIRIPPDLVDPNEDLRVKESINR